MVSSTFWMPAPELSVALPQIALVHPAAHEAVPYRPAATGKVVAAAGAAATVMLGDEPRFVSTPPAVAFDCACHVCAPAEDGAVAPGAPFPYVIVIVAPPASVTLDTVIVCAATATVPVLETV